MLKSDLKNCGYEAPTPSFLEEYKRSTVHNDWSRALKWGIVGICKSNSIGDMTKNEINTFFWHLRFDFL